METDQALERVTAILEKMAALDQLHYDALEAIHASILELERRVGNIEQAISETGPAQT